MGRDLSTIEKALDLNSEGHYSTEIRGGAFPKRHSQAPAFTSLGQNMTVHAGQYKNQLAMMSIYRKTDYEVQNLHRGFKGGKQRAHSALMSQPGK